MIIGTISDTHGEDDNVVRHVVAEFVRRDVELIVHCGDIERKHLNPELFWNLPVICALNEEQIDKPEFKSPPPDWIFTAPKDRVRDIGAGNSRTRIRVGHKRSYDFLSGTQSSLAKTLEEARRDYDGLRWYFAGHTHHQVFAQTRLTNFVNPGAIFSSFDGYEFAVIDTANSQAVFSRIPKTKALIPTFSIGVVSDSLSISKMDADFWKKLAEEFRSRDVGHIIHCGNIATYDVGTAEFDGFEVYYILRPDQRRVQSPRNWHIIPPDEPVVEINGYRFYVQLDLGASLLEQSELDMHRLCLHLRRDFPEIQYLFC